MNRLTLYFSITLLSTIFFSCQKDWLDAKSDSTLTVPSSLDDFQGMLDNTSAINTQSPAIGEVASDGHYVSESVYRNSAKSYRTDAYIWSRTVPHLKVSDWSISYTRVLYSNTILAGLEKIEPRNAKEADIWHYVKGQALFNRARSFFELAQIYAPPFRSTTADGDLGIVLRLSTDITLPSKRSSVKETYTQILKDLKEAEGLLPEQSMILTRASKAAVYALMSRVYLCMDDYDSALIASSQCLSIKSDLLNFNDLSTSTSFIGRLNKEVIFHCTLVPISLITSQCLIEGEFYDQFDVNDLRRYIYFRRNASGTISFKGNYESVTTTLFGGLAVDEVILTRAECYARLGKPEEAMSDLNTLVKARWNREVSYIDIVASDSEDALVKVLEHRKKELVLRGIRWVDLRRLNLDSRFSLILSRRIDDQTYTLEPGSFRYTFPIPDDIVGQSDVIQNKGWD